MTSYSVVIQTSTGQQDHEPLSARTDAGACKAMRAYLRSNPPAPKTKLYLAWNRDTDGCRGYLNPDGTASVTGESWRYASGRIWIGRETPGESTDPAEARTEPSIGIARRSALDWSKIVSGEVVVYVGGTGYVGCQDGAILWDDSANLVLVDGHE